MTWFEDGQEYGRSFFSSHYDQEGTPSETELREWHELFGEDAQRPGSKMSWLWGVYIPKGEHAE